jgi:hypothetical protein
MLVVGALRKLGASAPADQIRSYLSTLHGWFGAAGLYDFRDGSQRGLTATTMLVVRFDPLKAEFMAASQVGGVPLSR